MLFSPVAARLKARLISRWPGQLTKMDGMRCIPLPGARLCRALAGIFTIMLN